MKETKKFSFLEETKKFIERWKNGESSKEFVNSSVRSKRFSEEYMRMKYGMYLKDNKK